MAAIIFCCLLVAIVVAALAYLAYESARIRAQERADADLLDEAWGVVSDSESPIYDLLAIETQLREIRDLPERAS